MLWPVNNANALDPNKGSKLFAIHCAQCHTLGASTLSTTPTLWIADRVWCSYVNSITTALHVILIKVGMLDLKTIKIDSHRHEVLAKAETWITYEQQRCREICEQLALLSDETDPLTIEKNITILSQLRERLPHISP